MKCPECEAEIDHLLEVELWDKEYKLFPNGERKFVREAPAEGLIPSTIYRCPKCGWIIAEDYRTAVSLLRGKRGENVESLSTK